MTLNKLSLSKFLFPHHKIYCSYVFLFKKISHQKNVTNIIRKIPMKMLLLFKNR